MEMTRKYRIEEYLDIKRKDKDDWQFIWIRPCRHPFKRRIVWPKIGVYQEWDICIFCNVYGVIICFCFPRSKRSYQLKTRNSWRSNPNFPTTYGLETLDNLETRSKAKNKLPVIRDYDHSMRKVREIFVFGSSFLIVKVTCKVCREVIEQSFY
jgi:hypothetical protein